MSFFPFLSITTVLPEASGFDNACRQYVISTSSSDSITSETISPSVSRSSFLCHFEMLGYDFLYDQVMNSSDKWTGREWTGGEENEHGVSGYKLYLAMYGIVGGSLFFMAYLGAKVLLSRKIKLEWGLLTLIIMLMLQNAYPTWLCVMIPIVCGADYMFSLESES